MCLVIVDMISIWLNCPIIIWTSEELQFGDSSSSISSSLIYRTFAVFFSVFSSWITVTISFERLAAIYCPFSKLGTSGRHKPLIVLFILFICIVTTFIMITYVMNSNQRKFTAHLLYSILPGVLLLIMSILMIYKLLHPADLGQNVQQRSTSQSKNSIYLVITLNSVFLLATFPISISRFLKVFQSKSNETIVLLFDMIACFNNGINFILYFAVSKSFRASLKQICFKQDSVNRRSVYTLQSTGN